MKYRKVVIGIDIAKDKFDVCLSEQFPDTRPKVIKSGSFKNCLAGFQLFWTWCYKKQIDEDIIFVMEATGVYYEELACFLHQQNCKVVVALANKVNNFAKSINVKTKTDKVDAKIISFFGLERTLDLWEPMSVVFQGLRDLCREKISVQKETNRAKSQLHAMNHSANKDPFVVKLKLKQIEFYDELVLEIRAAIISKLKEDDELYNRVLKLESIPAIAFDTAIALISETNGFKLVKNIRQLTSYAGLDITFNESGCYKGRSRISKKGNSNIRHVLYMPAMSAVQYNQPIKKLHERICERNPTARQKGIIAAMRKLLILVYTLWTKDELYDKNYNWTQNVEMNRN